MQVIRRHFTQVGKPALAAALVAIILLLDAMAVSPELHEMIHKDASRADHHCAVTLLAQGKINSVACEIALPEPALSVEKDKLFIISVFSPAIQNLPRGRAPPFSSPVL